MTTTTAAAIPDRTASTRAASGVRKEIQALRALAVLGVLVYHLWPNRLPGGFVGVDVFFVVSGYLISDHLLREYYRTGGIGLLRFWARRVRRLLPASLLVLLVTTIAVWVWVPDSRWAQFGSEVIASALYVENWALAAQSVDYMALSNAKSPVQHFWSLGVEEQFYVVWPLLILLAIALAARMRSAPERAFWVVLSVVTVLSLAFSIYATFAQPSVAYFSTFTRAWEFGFGALLALLLRRFARPFPNWLAVVGSWSGFAMIAAAMIAFTASTPFPGYTALLPVVGTTLVIACGSPAQRLAPTRLFSLRPVQFIGDVSYGTYLWHWPLIVLLPYALGVPLTTPVLIGVLLASVALGWASKIFIEDPVRTHSLVSGTRTRWSFIGAAIAMAIVVAAALPLATYRVTPPSVPGAMPDCYGANAMVDTTCGPAGEIPLTARLSSFAIDVPPEDIRACELPTTAGDFRRCDFGDLAGPGPHVALIGDSHATRITEALREVTLAEGGSLSTYLVAGCSMMARELTGSAWGFEDVYAAQCLDVTTRIHDAVAGDPDIDTVILTNRTRLYITDEQAYHPLTAQMVDDSIGRLQAAGKRVIVLKDPPEMNAIPPQGSASAADCLSQASAPEDCTLPSSDARFADPMSAAAATSGVEVVDVDDAFCTQDRCLTRIGGLVVYSDDNHLTRSFALSLVGILADRLALSTS
ncbi:MAG TPA: acyltransferase family protein [Microbacterium sp.]|nr:acyltransferase family protein [Microbacterium sp.]